MVDRQSDLYFTVCLAVADGLVLASCRRKDEFSVATVWSIYRTRSSASAESLMVLMATISAIPSTSGSQDRGSALLAVYWVFCMVALTTTLL